MYRPIITNKAIIFKFEKPIYGSFFTIRDKWLKIAKQKNLNIVAETEFGKATYTYKTWMDGAEKIKKEFNIPGVPMIMYGRSVLPDIKKRTERKNEEPKMVENVMETLTKMPEKYRLEIKQKLGLL